MRTIIPARALSAILSACAVAVISVAGCAWQSEALKIADDTYQVSANASPARGGITGAREMALANANKKCDSLGRSITVTDVKTEWAFSTGSGTYLVAAHGIDGNGSGAAQKVIAFQAAGNFCKARGEEVSAVHVETTEPFFGRAPSASLEFRCVKPSAN